MTGIAAVGAAAGTIIATRRAAKIQNRASLANVRATKIAARMQATATSEAARSQVSVASEQLEAARAELRYVQQHDRALEAARNENESRRQAEQVTAWLGDEVEPSGTDDRRYLSLFIRNASRQVVYDLVASLVSLQGAFRETAIGDRGHPSHQYRALVGNVPPEMVTTKIGFDRYGMSLRFGVELAFRDARGRHWVRRRDGFLEEVDEGPLDLYEISRPVGWQR